MAGAAARGGGRLGLAAFCLGLVLAGAVAWWLQLRPGLAVDAAPLRTLPLRIGDWRGAELPLEQVVESVLRADFNLQRVYRHPAGGLVWLYIGYYGTDRGGRPEHTPWGCYTGAGWNVESRRRIWVDRSTGLRANEFVVERKGELRLVEFWYRSHRRTGMVGGLDQNLDRLLGRLLDGRADGALVRVSTPMPDGDVVAARTRLLGFAAALDRELVRHWPRERRRRRNANR